MNPDKTNPGATETKHPDQTNSTGVTRQGNRHLLKSFSALTAAFLAVGAASCVAPYDSPGGAVITSSYRPGYTVTSLPGGYRSEMISGRNYYYHNGSYYRQGSSGYVIVEAPRNSRYRDDYTRRQQPYQPSRNNQSSNRDDPRNGRGETINRLPEGYRVTNHRGNTYYQAGNQYYRRQGDSYRLTAKPD